MGRPYNKKKVTSQSESKETIDKVAREIEDEIIRTGKNWVFTIGDMPIGQLTQSEVFEVIKEVRAHYSNEESDCVIVDVESGKRYTISEFEKMIYHT